MPKGRGRKKPTHKANRKPEAPRPTEFDKLLRFIVTFQGRFALAFICGEDRRQRQGVLASLADLLRERGIELRQIDLTYREVTDLYNTLKEDCRQNSPAAIVVTGIEASLRGPLLASLNIQRDLISREISCPLLFWVSNFALTVIAREAPDFYDFRHTVFNFKAVGDGEPSTMGDPILWNHFPVLHPAGSSERRTAYLLDQLARYQKDESRLELRDKLAYAELLEEVARNEKNRPEARIYLERALTIYEELHAKDRQAVVLHHIADIDYYTGNPTGAENNLAKALSLYRDIKDRFGEANILQSLGDVQRFQSAYAEAEALYQQALPLYRELGSWLGEANVLWGLGVVKLLQDAYEEAEQLCQQVLPLYRDVGSRLGEANALRGLGDIKRMQHAYAEAEQFYPQALELYRDVRSRLGEANVLQHLGIVKAVQSAYSDAEQLYQQALAIHREIGSRLGEANALRTLGDVQLAQTAYTEAEQLYSKAFAIYASIDDKYSQGETLLSLAEVYRTLGDQEKAHSLADQAKELLASFSQMVQKGEHVMQELS